MVEARNQNPLRQSLQQQAELLDRLVGRCVVRNGGVADETVLVITREEAYHLTALSNRLHLMAPYQDQIRRVVTGR